MIVVRSFSCPAFDNANALVLHDLVTKVKNFVKGIKSKVISGGHYSKCRKQ